MKAKHIRYFLNGFVIFTQTERRCYLDEWSWNPEDKGWNSPDLSGGGGRRVIRACPDEKKEQRGARQRGFITYKNRLWHLAASLWFFFLPTSPRGEVGRKPRSSFFGKYDRAFWSVAINLSNPTTLKLVEYDRGEYDVDDNNSVLGKSAQWQWTFATAIATYRCNK